MTAYEIVKLQRSGVDDEVAPGVQLVYGLFDAEGRADLPFEYALREGDDPIRVAAPNPDVTGGCWKSWCVLPDYMLDPSLPQPPGWPERIAECTRRRERREAWWAEWNRDHPGEEPPAPVAF